MNNRRHFVEQLESRQLMAGDLVLEWNAILLDAVRTDRTAPPVAARAMAIVHTAIYDAVNAIDRTHEPYAVRELALPLTSREAAVVAAAHAALSSLFPMQQDMFDDAREADLAAIPDGPAEDLGVALGETVAAQILALRADDGATAVVDYEPGSLPGQWQPTPPSFVDSLLPQWPDVTPFAMTSGSQFSPDDIPALTSGQYTKAFNEVKSLGESDSTTRTVDQTNIALFWANGAGTATPAGHLNLMAVAAAEKKGNTLSENARLFAMLNVALADAAILAWDCKYATDFWRPVTGIRAADTDGNPNTVADPAWTPLIATPPFSTYVSGHSSFSGAAESVLRSFFGRDKVTFTLASEAAGVPDRTFKSFSQAAQESADSRLYGGIHWRFDNEDGLTAGQKLGKFVAKNFFGKMKGSSADADLVGGVLVVQGTDKSEDLTLIESFGVINVLRNGKTLGSFDVALIAAIVIDARGGNDVVRVGDSTSISASVHGGDGNDRLFGGAADDLLFGDRGNDRLFGGLGDDLLDGGDGNDLFFDGPGDDTIVDRRGRRLRFG